MVKLTDHDSLSRETVRRRLAENHLKPWQRDMWCIPKVDAEYVARMEDVLDLYAEQPDPKRPVVCFDESPTQLHRRSAPADPGRAGTAPTLRLRISPQRLPSISSSSLTPIALGAGSRSLIVAPLTTSPFACANSSMSTSKKPSASASSSTTSQPTPPPLSTPPSHRSRRAACSGGSSFTIPQARQLAQHG